MPPRSEESFSAASATETRSTPRTDESPASARSALDAARTYLLSIQGEDGHWCGELEGDTILESEYILTMVFLGRGNDPRVGKAAESLRRQQLDEGGWSIYPGGPAEPSASVKAYFVLKIAGDSPSDPHMERARKKILDLGGVEACNSFTKTYLAMFRQYDWNRCPAVPPEMILLPKKFIFNIYEMSSWSRAIVVPLSIIWALKPTCTVPEHANIPELFVRRPGMSLNAILPVSLRAVMTTVFHGIDRSLKVVERLPAKPLRAKALERAERWILRRLENSDGLGAIFPPIINTIFALRALGYAVQHPVIQQQIGELEKLIIEEDETLRVQPCFSPVWDTALAVTALLDAGPAEDPALLAAARWLMGKEVKQSGDWEVKVPGVKPGGWYFEYANEHYPDCDDTAEVLAGLSRIALPDAEEDEQRRAALDRALDWILAMQNRDGGWGAFDRNCNMEILTFVPFADHNAMIDPSCEDITGRVLEALSVRGFDRSHPAVRRGVEFLLRKQEADGTWFGRWGCNYIYGTWLALRGLEEAGVDLSQPRFQKAAAWLRDKQNADGGWGELPQSYDDPQTKGEGPSTSAQTAWALMGLFATGDFDSESVCRGVAYLQESQFSDGSWHDEYWTGTGFPNVFYLRYHLYAIYFPLQALATYCRGTEGRGATARLRSVVGEAS